MGRELSVYTRGAFSSSVNVWNICYLHLGYATAFLHCHFFWFISLLKYLVCFFLTSWYCKLFANKFHHLVCCLSFGIYIFQFHTVKFHQFIDFHLFSFFYMWIWIFPFNTGWWGCHVYDKFLVFSVGHPGWVGSGSAAHSALGVPSSVPAMVLLCL